MPIEFVDSPEGLRVRQSIDAPAVYLDHWAIRLFSDDRARQDRFVAALKQKRGTLLLSNFSLAEMGGASESQHAIDTESLLERCLPNLFLTNFRLDDIQVRELQARDNAMRFWPTADLTQLKVFGELSLKAGSAFSLMMKGRLAKSKLAGMPIAKCFSQRAGGVDAFLADLEQFDPRSQPPPARP